MPLFSQTSLNRLYTCHPDLRDVFNVVIDSYDCVVLEGERTEEQQIANVEKGVSRTLASKHLARPSLAVDVAPYPVDWNNRERFVHFAGFVLGVSAVMGIPIRWGGDWDGDHDLKDQTFFDLVHFELAKK